MAIGDSNLEEEEKSKVSILDLKEMLRSLFGKKLISRMNGLVDDF